MTVEIGLLYLFKFILPTAAITYLAYITGRSDGFIRGFNTGLNTGANFRVDAAQQVKSEIAKPSSDEKVNELN